MKEKNKVLEALKSVVSNTWYVIFLVAVCTAVIVMICKWSATLKILGNAVEILMPFIFGFFFAYLIYPLVKMIRNSLNKIKPDKGLKVKKALSVLIAYIVVIGILTIIIIYIFPQLKDSSKEMGNTIQHGYQYMISNSEEINNKIPFFDLKEIFAYLEKNAPTHILNYSSDIMPYVFRLSSSLLTTVYNVLIGLVISIYLVIDGRNLMLKTKEIVYSITPKGKEKNAWNIILECNHIFNGFLFGKMIDSLIIGIITLIVMSILRLPYPLMLSVIVGITNMIPYFGPFIGAVPGVLIYLFIDPKLSLIFAVMILAIQQFDGLYLGPKILGDLTGIKPLWVIFGVTVGGALFGVMGMFLGVPTVAVITYLFGLHLEKRLARKNMKLSDIK